MSRGRGRMRGCASGTAVDPGSGPPAAGCCRRGRHGLCFRGWRWRFGQRGRGYGLEEGRTTPVGGRAGIPLTSLAEGTGGRIVGLDTEDPLRLQRLLALGLVPGVQVEVVQRFPCYVVVVNLTQVALDIDTARAVYVAVDGSGEG